MQCEPPTVHDVIGARRRANWRAVQWLERRRADRQAWLDRTDLTPRATPTKLDSSAESVFARATGRSKHATGLAKAGWMGFAGMVQGTRRVAEDIGGCRNGGRRGRGGGRGRTRPSGRARCAPARRHGSCRRRRGDRAGDARRPAGSRGALASAVRAAGLPAVETGHRVVGSDRCHFTAPASMPDEASQPSGRLLLTSGRAIFVGGANGATAPWHSVGEALHLDRDLVLIRSDRDKLYRFRCNTFSDALRGRVPRRASSWRRAAARRPGSIIPACLPTLAAARRHASRWGSIVCSVPIDGSWRAGASASSATRRRSTRPSVTRPIASCRIRTSPSRRSSDRSTASARTCRTT